MVDIKSHLSLYLNSFKRSFDLEGKPTEGEFANFIQVSASFLVVLLICFWNNISYIVLSSGKDIATPMGLVVFCCYGMFAMFPFAGIVARRFKQYDIDLSIVTKLFNKSTFLVSLLFVTPLILGALLNSIELMPFYSSFIFIFSFCYYIGRLPKIKDKLLQDKDAPKKKFIISFVKFFALLVAILFCIMRPRNFLDLFNEPVLLLIFCLYILPAALFLSLLVLYPTSIFLLIIIITIFCNNFDNLAQIIYSIASSVGIVDPDILEKITLCIVLGIFLFVLGVFIYIIHDKNKYKTLYLPLILWMVLVPRSAWIEVKNMSFSKVEQNIESIKDKQLNSLTIPLLKTMVAENPEGNILISAHNIYQGLSVLAHGAEGQTLEKLKTLLGSSALENIDEKNREIIRNHSNALKFKNQIFATTQHLDKNFVKTIKNDFDYKLRDNPENCKIDFSSTVTFVSLWKDEFWSAGKREFHTPNGVVEVPMFRGEYDVYIANGSNFRILGLYYKSGDIFYIILPDSQTIPVRDVLNVLDKELPNLHFEKHNMKFIIPEFEIENDIKFESILTSLGVGNLFERGNSELGKVLSENASKDIDCAPNIIYIDNFSQKNKITVDEKGTKAISVQEFSLNFATGGIISLPFVVDRPFIFMINNGAFVGVINDPSKNN